MTAAKLSDSEISVQIEALRKRAHPLIMACWVLLGICVLCTVIVSFLSESGAIEMSLGVALPIAAIGLAGFALGWVGLRRMGELKKFVSENLVRGVLEEFFTLEKFDLNGRIPGSVIKNIGMINAWERSSGSDYVAGNYKKLGIEFSDIKLTRTEYEKEKDGERKEREVTVFQGPWLVCNFGIDLPARLMIRENERLSSGKYRKDGNDLDTENVAFNERYEIRTGDDHTAFYILTPHFMEKIQEINDRAMGRLFICFDGSRAHIAVNSGHDSFEIGSSASAYQDFDKLRERFRTEIRYLTDILDELMLNDKLYKE